MALDQVDIDDYYYKDGPPPGTGKEMSFLEHLEQLRWHIVRSVVAILIAAICLFAFKTFLFERVVFGPKNDDFFTYRALCYLSGKLGWGDSLCFKPVEFALQGVDFAEAFLLHIKVSFVLGFVIAFPYVFYQGWSFIRPGLHDKERRATRGIVLICTILFLIGVSFGYFIVAPFAVNFLASYTLPHVTNAPRVTSFVNYMIMFVLPAGMIFELPIVVYFLSKVGLATPAGMRQYRKHAFVSILILAALITPPDVVTQFLIGIPLYILYEISIFISARVEKNRIKADKEMLDEITKAGH